MSLDNEKSTEGMIDYNENSSAQQRMVSRQNFRIRSLVGRLGEIRPEMRIVDFGCGPGKSTIEITRPAVAAYAEQFPGAPVVVCHADQPGNDWNSLFALAFGPSGCIAGQDHIRVEAAIGSFYERMAAPSSVAIATCFAASHWSSRAVRLYAPDTIWFADLEGDTRAEMWALAKSDWTRFLRLRAEELISGGFLLVSTLGSVPDESERNGVSASGSGIYRALQAVAANMAADGLIRREVLNRFIFALWFLTADEAREPLETDPELCELFEIEEISVTSPEGTQDDFFAALIGDPAEYAKAYRGYIRAFADSTLRTQLFEPSAADPADTDTIADAFYDRLENLYRQHLSKYAFKLWNLTVLLRKR